MDFLTKDLLLKKRTSFSFLFGSKKPTFALHDDNLDDQPPRYYDVFPQRHNETAIARNEAKEDEDNLLSSRQELSPDLEAQVRYACSLLVYRIEQGISSNYCPNRAKDAAAARKKRISTITTTSTLSGSSAAAAAQVEAKYLLSSTTKKLRNGMIGRFGNGIFARDGSEKHDSGVGLTQQPSIATMREGQRSKLGSSHSNYTTTQREGSLKAGKSQVGATAAVARGEESMVVSPISPTAPEGEEDVIISPITVSTTTTTTTESENTVYRTVPTSLSPTDSSNNETSSEDTSPTSSVDPSQQQHIHHQFLTRGAAVATGEEKKPCQRDQDTAAFLSPTDPVPNQQQHNSSASQDESPDATNDSDVEVFLDADTAAEYITSSAGGVGGVGGPGGVAMPLLTTSTPSLGLSSVNSTSVRQSKVYNPPAATAAATTTSVLITEAEIAATEEEEENDTSKTKRHSTYTPTYPLHLPPDEILSGRGGEDEPPTIIDTNGNAHIMTSAEELERDLGLQQAVMTKMKTGSILLLSSSSSSSSPTTASIDGTGRTHMSHDPAPTTTDSGNAPDDTPTPTLPRLPEPTHTVPPRRPGTSASRLKTSWSALSHSTASVSGRLRRRFRRHDDNDDDDSVIEMEMESRRATPTTLFRRLAGWLTGRGSPREKEEEDRLPRTSSGLEGVLPYQGT
ncbi:hypothetical protein ASPACDRAFT_46363 [Aspergillus aculeatus ATCC 16872]|uniref:Uncharacterized protein n=1 Tax=Aspergillus aculeatus (strain ATCC 16872 / CBS 172.66 / WB 5094) TaxID=690307 RepID=A0A1L9WL01_ASPA1|nr:uncharacterized protein ASPACDRAFT_46363 [Aspergillus aculeatus ATCC 16872]OJJ96838.1 hypothetical protein ASPACDRAFT_46363 [Aspergillus aculeatus ATCC 16872]